MRDVQIVVLEQRGRVIWQVKMGQRGVSFHEELAARTFAAQLHMRLEWLRQQRDAAPPLSHEPSLPHQD
ncbi:hypothetical protein PSm6_57880 [Pseudomonas solani]|uniref:Uncharacterized protein n=1 Tax=Pseudomonas solani TaxID=2731552 RepID=A0AAU7YC05_9PSED|nr:MULTISPECIES: hypothetical protein [Pseudomonas]EQM67478.1 hypothetical protein L682_21795 [Pseudomonas alcaligenes OT 69]MDN4149530.1 hypothetical protein [Pseudomonas tohonis]MCU9948421.1 hypothetical protein [Pseudomonas sp. PDM13]MDU9414226.1 hypothetical protein [Pseudomonas sp. zfem005]WCD78157.1 hypothetical protein PI990_19340 [Pseudomonas sp. TUM22785]